MTKPDTAVPSEQIFTASQAAKRLGIPVSTLRRLIRDGTFWATPMQGGELGLSESEIQRFIDRFGDPKQRPA